MMELTLPTMTCGHCVKTVTATVQRVDPTAQLSIELATHQVRIVSAKPLAEFVRELSEEGYAPSSTAESA